jgi:subtilase family serine protease
MKPFYALAFAIIANLPIGNVSFGQPDLIVLSPVVSPTTVNVGSSVSLSCSVKNQGNAKADFGIFDTKGLTYYLSTNSTYSTDDVERRISVII